MTDQAMDPMVAAFIAHMQGPARAYDKAVLPCLSHAIATTSVVTRRDGAVVVTYIGPLATPRELAP